jgi:hypothetical protein
MCKVKAMAVLILAIAGGAAAQEGGFRHGEWRSQDVPDGYAATTHGRYQMQSNCSPDVVKRVGRHMNAMFKAYSKSFPSQKTPKFGLVIKLFADVKQFYKFGASPGVGGFYSPIHKEMVGYYTGKMDGELAREQTTGAEKNRWSDAFERLRAESTLDTLGVFSHEGWHQYYHWSCGSQVEFPSWSDEGIGEYFYPAWMKGEQLVLGAPNDYRLESIQEAIAQNQHVKLAKLVTYEQRDYYSNPDTCYAEGWSLVHFFFEHPDYAPKNIMPRYVATFRDQHSIEKTNAIAFAGFDWEAIEKEWINWVMAMPPAMNLADLVANETDEATRAEMAVVLDAQAARVKKHQALLSEKARKALNDCIARRKPRAGDGAAAGKPVAEKPAAEKPAGRN